MNEDPTRLMSYGDEPPRRRRPQNQPPKGNLRLVVLIMGVVIFGLLIGLISSCGGGGTKTVTQTKQITIEEPAPQTSKGTETPAEEEEKEAEEAETGETGEAEETEVPEETGGVEEFLPEEVEEGTIEEGGGEVEEVPEVVEEEPEGGGVPAG